MFRRLVKNISDIAGKDAVNRSHSHPGRREIAPSPSASLCLFLPGQLASAHNPSPRLLTSSARPRSGLEAWSIKPGLELNHRYQKTLARLLEHPPNLNVHWKEVQHLLENGLGATIEHTRTGPHKAFLAGEMVGTFRPTHSYLRGGDVANVRRMLVRSGVVARADHRATDGASASGSGLDRPDRPQELHSDGKHVVVFVDHHEARVFDGAAKGTEEAVRLHPFYPESYRSRKDRGAGRHNKPGSLWHGVVHDEDPEYYRAIVDLVKDRDEIVLAGITTIKKNSAVSFLLEEMKKHFSEEGVRVSDKVVGTIYVDRHDTDPQMLSKARECYNKIHPIE